MIANGLIKILLVIKYKYFVRMTRIKIKNNYWLLLNKNTILKTFFNNVELILAKHFGLKSLRLKDAS